MIGGFRVWVRGDNITLPCVPRLGDVVTWRHRGSVWLSERITRVELTEDEEMIEVQTESID